MRGLLVVLMIALAIPAFALSGDYSTERVLNDTWDDDGNQVRIAITSADALDVSIVSADVFIRPAETFRTGQATGIAASLSEALSDDALAIREVTVGVLAGNAIDVYVGFSGDSVDTATSSAGFRLSSDHTESITIRTDDLRDVWINAEEIGDGVSWLAIPR